MAKVATISDTTKCFPIFFEKIFKIVDCSDATTDACCVFTAAHYATSLMADVVVASASGVGKRTMGALGE